MVFHVKNHHHPTLSRYITDKHIACNYDSFFQHSYLFQFDSRILQEWFHEPGKIIDFGSGTGRHVLQFCRRGFDVTGVDLSDHMLAITKTKLDKSGCKARLIKADMTAPWPTNDITIAEKTSYDYALCMFSTLGMIRGRNLRHRFLTNVLHCLKPGGLFALHIHNYWHNLWYSEGRLFLAGNTVKCLLGWEELGDKILPEYRGIKNMFVHVFRKSEIEKQLQTAGFDILHSLPLNETRSGILPVSNFNSIRANGYLILTQKPE